MSDQIIVMPGANRLDLGPLVKVAQEFGWTVGTTSDPRSVAALIPGRKPLAVLFQRDALGPNCSWAEAVRRLSGIAPGVRLIVCHSFGDSVNWSDIHSAGAFHALPVPFRESEVRQSLGFILDAEKRLADASDTLLRRASSGLSVVARRAAS